MAESGMRVGVEAVSCPVRGIGLRDPSIHPSPRPLGVILAPRTPLV